MFWKKSALLLVFVQPYKEESVPGIGDTGSVPVWLVVLSCGRDGEEEACLVSGAIQCQGPARGRRVCSFIGVGFPWPLRFLVYESSGDLVCVRVSSEERLVRQLEERARMEPEQEKESLVLFLRRGDRRRG